MPSLRCHIPGCVTHCSERVLHSFPRNRKKARLWLNAIKNRTLASLPIKQVYRKTICSKHFTESSFKTSQRTSLKSNAVPSLNLNPSPDFDPSKCNFQDDITSSVITDNEIITDTNPCSIITSTVNYRVFSNDRLRNSPEPQIQEKSIDQRCRICLMNTDNAIPLNHSTNISGEDRQTLCEILNKFSKVEIAVGDNKPQSVCIDCVEKARIAYELSICCEKSEIVLQKELENNSAPVTCIIDGSEFVKTNEKKTSTSLVKYETIDSKCKELVNSGLENVYTTTNEEYVYTRKVTRAVKKVNKILCVQCCRNFSRYVKFNLYTSVIIGKKRYQCVKCEARFASRRNLKLHKISHKGMLRYKYPKIFLM